MITIGTDNPNELLEAFIQRAERHVNMQTHGVDGATLSQVLRVFLNLHLLLTDYRLRAEQLHPGQWRQIELNRQRGGHWAAQAHLMALGECHRLFMEDQTIAFCTEERNLERIPPQGGGWSVRPHWRRGFWRRQPCGMWRCERKLVFIKPTAIHRDRVMGVDSTIEYIGNARHAV